MHGSEQPVYADHPVVLGGVLKDSPAEKAGLRAGDHIVSFAGVKDPTWERINLELVLPGSGHSIPVVVDRGGNLISLSVEAGQQPGAAVGYPSEPVLVGSVTHGLPADQAGLKPGDTIVAANGQPVNSPIEFSPLVQHGAGSPLALKVLRAGQTLDIPLRPIWGDPGDGGGSRWEIGISFRFATEQKRYSLPESLARAAERNFILADKTLYVVEQLFTGRVSIKQMQGPLGIMQASSQAAKQGFGDLISLMAYVSLQLGILNLLPIPILDGGHIVMLAIEGLLRHDLALKIKERVVTAGMVFLLLIFVIVMYNDVLRLFPGH
jgi:regulator of sigma E protease